MVRSKPPEEVRASRQPTAPEYDCRAMPRPSTPEDAMRGFLSGEDAGMVRFRHVMRRIPHGPNCKLCAAPFEGPGGAVLRHFGFARFPGNPSICGSCIKDLNKLGVLGAEIQANLLFADIRGSTGIGERMTPTEFRAFLDSFYQLSSRTILDNASMSGREMGPPRLTVDHTARDWQSPGQTHPRERSTACFHRP